MTELASRIRALPGMDALLGALPGLPPVYLVGGAVRDLLLGGPLDDPDIDLAVEGDGVLAARRLAARLDGEAVEHGRFGTATVRAGELTVDLASTRRERYGQPGGLPEVEPAPLVEDLTRRDFTINAMAAPLSPAELGSLQDPHGGAADLRAGTIRILHERSFIDDPTRLLRAARYAARLGFALEAETERLAREAAAAGALARVSGPRLRDALLGLLAEADCAAAVAHVGYLGLDRSMHPALSADPDRVASAALGAVETGADRVLAALAALVTDEPGKLREWLEYLALGRERTARVARAADDAPRLAAALCQELRPSQLHRLLAAEPREALALALGLGAPADPILRYLADLSHVRLEVTGDDLVAAGIAPSPAIGRALEETLARKLDAEVSGRDEELAVALELAHRAGRQAGGR